MIYNDKVTPFGARDEALQYIAVLKGITPNFTLIDVGATANPWTKDYVTHVVDIETAAAPNTKHFCGNISDVKVWDEVLAYVKDCGKFDFLVCTHTLEDISAAVMVCGMFSKIAKQGFIAIPSKYQELARHEGPWRGYIHHRWIYDVVNGKFIGYPKQPFLEHISEVDEWVNKNSHINREELQFFWKGEIALDVINGDLLGPTVGHVMQYYKQLVG